MTKPLRVRPTEKKQRTFSVLVENEPGVLSRIAGLFSARGFNIVSLAVGETQDPTVSRMTIVTEGTEAVLEQINKQLNKLIPVISVRNLEDGEFVDRELMLVKIGKTDEARVFIDDYKAEYHWSIVDESPEHFVVQVVAAKEDIQSIFDHLRQFEVVEVCRTGRIAMTKKYKIGITDKV